jgi:hypothetical protein
MTELAYLSPAMDGYDYRIAPAHATRKETLGRPWKFDRVLAARSFGVPLTCLLATSWLTSERSRRMLEPNGLGTINYYQFGEVLAVEI